MPSFLNYFKSLSVGPVPGIEPATSGSAMKRSADWANPAAYFENLQRDTKTKTKLISIRLVKAGYATHQPLTKYESKYYMQRKLHLGY